VPRLQSPSPREPQMFPYCTPVSQDCPVRIIHVYIPSNIFGVLILAKGVIFPFIIYRVFQKELYNFKRVYTFIQKTCTVF
jgi:hypothetical protein